ncbi:MAG TPA: hypothetical protein VES97_09390 [Solirubrobacteraceae bacterium]|nr:hypothetical protein [Solirubrobacteraceae bacterium]
MSSAAAVAAPAEPVVHYEKESLQAYEQQLAAGQIRTATFNRRVRSLRLTLKDGTHALVHYAAKGEPKLAAALKAKGVPITVLKPAEASKEVVKKPVHHKLRYIAGGIVVGLIVIVGIVLLIDRSRKRRTE